MSDRESHQASIDASEASIPAENGSREVENDPPPLGSDEERERCWSRCAHPLSAATTEKTR